MLIYLIKFELIFVRTNKNKEKYQMSGYSKLNFTFGDFYQTFYAITKFL